LPEIIDLKNDKGKKSGERKYGGWINKSSFSRSL